MQLQAFKGHLQNIVGFPSSYKLIKKFTFKLILLTFRALSSVKIQSFADLFSYNKYGFES